MQSCNHFFINFKLWRNAAKSCRIHEKAVSWNGTMSSAARIPNDTVITNDDGNKPPIHILCLNSTYCAPFPAATSILPHLIDAQSNIHTNDDDDDDGDDYGECELTEARILWNIDVVAGSKTMSSLSVVSSPQRREILSIISFALARWWIWLNCVDNHSNNHKCTWRTATQAQHEKSNNEEPVYRITFSGRHKTLTKLPVCGRK